MIEQETFTTLHCINDDEVFKVKDYEVIMRKKNTSVKGCECICLTGNVVGCTVCLPGTMIVERVSYVQ